MVSPEFALLTALRKEPLPLSFVLVTVMTVEKAGSDQNDIKKIMEKNLVSIVILYFIFISSKELHLI